MNRTEDEKSSPIGSNEQGSVDIAPYLYLPPIAYGLNNHLLMIATSINTISCDGIFRSTVWWVKNVCSFTLPQIVSLSTYLLINATSFTLVISFLLLLHPP